MLIYTLGVFSQNLHSCSWGKVVQQHTTFICFVVPGTGRIFSQSFFTTLRALSGAILWGLCPLRKIPNIFPFHFSLQEGWLPGKKSAVTNTNLLPWKPLALISSSPHVVKVKIRVLLGGFPFVFSTVVSRSSTRDSQIDIGRTKEEHPK